MIIEGRVWKFGNGLKAAHFFNGKYDILSRQHKYDELATHILEDHEPGFHEKIKPGDIFVVGESFGTGKHLWGPIGAFRALGIQAVLARSLSTSWERNSLNSGYPSLVCPQVYDLVETGGVLRLDLQRGHATNLTTGEEARIKPIAAGILELIEAGGIAALTSAKLGIRDALSAQE